MLYKSKDHRNRVIAKADKAWDAQLTRAHGAPGERENYVTATRRAIKAYDAVIARAAVIP